MAEPRVAEAHPTGPADSEEQLRPNRHRLVPWALMAAGAMLVGVGVLGIFVPLLPSTVFLLGAAACFGRSWPAAYRWLMHNRWFGQHLRDYQQEKGATAGAKALSIGTLWLGIGASGYFVVDGLWVRAVLLVVAVMVTWHLLRLRTIRR
mgnify:CR=1 FL=1